jgi:hypothetical protein
MTKGLLEEKAFFRESKKAPEDDAFCCQQRSFGCVFDVKPFLHVRDLIEVNKFFYVSLRSAYAPYFSPYVPNKGAYVPYFATYVLNRDTYVSFQGCYVIIEIRTKLSKTRTYLIEVHTNRLLVRTCLVLART